MSAILSRSRRTASLALMSPRLSVTARRLSSLRCGDSVSALECRGFWEGALEQAPTPLVDPAPSLRLRLDPAASWARAICSITALRDHTFQPHPLGSSQ